MRTVLNDTFRVLSADERRRLVILIFLDFIVSILDVLFIVALLYLATSYSNFSYYKTDPGHFTVFKQHPILLITIFFVLFSLKNFAAYQVLKAQYNFVYAVASGISLKQLVQYLRGDYRNFVETDSSVHIHRINQQPVEFCHYVLKGIFQVVSQSLLLLVTLVAILIYNAQLLLILLVLLVPPVLFVTYLLRKKLHLARTYVKATSEKSLQHLQEALNGYVESKIYARENFFTNRYHAQQKQLNKYLSDQNVLQNIPSRVIEVFAIFGVFVLILYDSLSTTNATLPLVTVGAFIAASYKIIPGVVKIMNSIGQVKTYAYTCKDLAPTGDDKKEVSYDEPDTIRSFELHKVSLRYKRVEVLNNFSLKVKQGDFFGMTGNSGKGKTSMLNLLLGFISPAHGSISINEIPQFHPGLYWKNISYVKQQPFIINDTIRKNITLHETYCDDRKLSTVMCVTGVDQIVQISPNGLNTIITEHGKNLSGGERQRIALARALYKDFDMLVLDEPFSELDEVSEAGIMSYLREISAGGKIVILITHNKNVLSFCNKTSIMNEYD